jgi:hypothetical protein
MPINKDKARELALDAVMRGSVRPLAILDENTIKFSLDWVLAQDG